MSKETQEIFKAMLKESGMPISEAEAKAEWNKCVQEQGTLVKNNSAYSPFWRVVEALITKPVMWVVNLLVDHALPNTFLMFARSVWLDVYAWGVDVARKAEVAGQGELLFSRSSASGNLTIPVGTVVESPLLNGIVYRMITKEEGLIPDGALGALVKVQAEKAGTAYNLGPGYYSILAKPVPGVVSVSNPDNWLITPGADIEADDNLRLRARNQFAAVGQYHHDAGYKALISEFAGVNIDYIFFQKEAPRGPGTANGFILIESGVPPQVFIDEINTFIRESGNHGHGDDLQLFPMPGVPQDLVVKVYPKLDLNLTEEEKASLRDEVINRIRCVFRQNTDFQGLTKTLPLSRFSFSRLGEELHDVPEIRSVIFDRSDIVLDLQIPVLNSLKVTIEGGL